MHWYVEVLKKYAVFSGRAGRSEYWFFALFNFLIVAVLAIGGAIINGANAEGPGRYPFALYWLAVLLPSLGVSVRRMHDIGRSGWWLLIGFIPFIGGIILIVWACQDSQPGTNAYGPNPKESTTETVAVSA